MFKATRQNVKTNWHRPTFLNLQLASLIKNLIKNLQQAQGWTSSRPIKVLFSNTFVCFQMLGLCLPVTLFLVQYNNNLQKKQQYST